MIIAVDFDGTCVDHRYPGIGDPVPHAVDVLRELVQEGHQLILYTMRSGIFLDDAENFFVLAGIPLYGIQTNPTQKEWTDSPKCYAQLYIDDAAFGCPLIEVPEFERPCVDWLKVREKLIKDTKK
jgi:hypothetical protein